MNLNCQLLARITRKPEITIEQHWRKSKSFARIEDQKRNYMLAWQGVLKMLSLPCRSVPEIGDPVLVGHFLGKVVRYDKEFVWLKNLDRRANPGDMGLSPSDLNEVVGIPITIMLLSNEP